MATKTYAEAVQDIKKMAKEAEAMKTLAEMKESNTSFAAAKLLETMKVAPVAKVAPMAVPVAVPMAAAPVVDAPIAPFLVVDVEHVQRIMRAQRGRDRHVSRLDDRANIERFRTFFKQEISDLIEDAVEIAFLRTFADIMPISRQEPESEPESDDEDEDDSHDFEYKTHCDNCEQSWWQDHDLESCVEYQMTIHCLTHMGHDGEKCGWDSACDKHAKHTLENCLDACNEIHHDSEWHTAVENGYVEQHDHDLNHPDCTYFKKAEADLIPF